MKDVKINIHKDVFGVNDNDPRIYGVSSEGNENYLKIKKGNFLEIWEIKVHLLTREMLKLMLKNMLIRFLVKI